MFTRCLYFSLLLPALAFGQAFTPTRPFTFSSASCTPTCIPGLAYWWVYGDQPWTNAAATNWIDRLQLSTWTNAEPGKLPTNTPIGMQFKATASTTNFFTNNASIGSTSTRATNSHWFIVFFNYVSQTTGDFLSATNVSGGDRATVDKISSGRINLEGQGGGSFNLILGQPLTNHWMDVCYVNSSDESAGTVTIYTNGVSAGSSGATPYWPDNTSWRSLGARETGFRAFDGYFREIAIWTNTALTQAQITQLHLYATNFYGFTP